MDYAGWDVYREEVSDIEAKETLNSTTLAPENLVLKVSIWNQSIYLTYWLCFAGGSSGHAHSGII